MKILFLLWSLFLSVNSYAQFWSFTDPVDITRGNINKVYHHLESAGRRNIAISSNVIAVVWEDNRDDNPSVYLALKNKNEENFSTELKVSGQGEAYEPSIVSLANNRFAISWEENSKIHVRVINAEQLKKPELSASIQLSAKEAMQSSLIANGDQIYVTLSERVGRYNQIRLIQLDVEHQENIKSLKDCRIDPEPVKNDQLYPAAVMINDRIMVAWEDRRLGHTIIMGAMNQSGDVCQFSQPQRISLRPGKRQLPFGKGHGVSRVALGQYGEYGILAAWADKRNFREGYDIFAAVYDKSGSWGENQSVQDDFGGVARQWHATVTGHPMGRRVVAWSDERENTSDVFYSWYEEGEWSEDMPIPGASGAGEQTHPSIILDEQGNLHLIWIMRTEVGAATRLRYLFGRLI